MTDFQLSDENKQALLELARQSIRHGLDFGTPLRMSRKEQDKLGNPFNRAGACFVTLKINDELRGCLGTLEPHRSLVDDVITNAHASAFRDSRFSPLREQEFEKIHISISVLTPVEEMFFSSEANLMEQIRPFEDGLILEEGMRKGTFLPSVWEQLPDKNDFMQHLKNKAGLATDYWSPSIRCFRYGSISFEE